MTYVNVLIDVFRNVPMSQEHARWTVGESDGEPWPRAPGGCER